MDYIKFIKGEKITAEIHSNGKTRTITNTNNVNKLLEICKKYGYKITTTCYLEKYASNIKNDYEKFYNKKKNKLVIYNRVNNLMKLTKSKNLNKTIVTIGTLVALAFLTPNKNADSDITTIKVEAEFNTDDEKTDDEKTDDEKTDIIIESDSSKTPFEETKIGIPKMLEMESMLNDNTPEFTFDLKNDNEENFENVKQYEDIFKKYGEMYGTGDTLLMLIACQESGGNHYEYLYGYPAVGIMQIERAAHVNTEITAYNHLEKKEETFLITDENITDLDTNIKIGAMLFQNALEQSNYNIPLALQTYNFGIGNINQALKMCEDISGISQTEMKNDVNQTEWRYYREFIGAGDPKYTEHVLSYLPENEIISVENRKGEKVSIKITNEALKSKTI